MGIRIRLLLTWMLLFLTIPALAAPAGRQDCQATSESHAIPIIEQIVQAPERVAQYATDLMLEKPEHVKMLFSEREILCAFIEGCETCITSVCLQDFIPKEKSWNLIEGEISQPMYFQVQTSDGGFSIPRQWGFIELNGWTATPNYETDLACWASSPCRIFAQRMETVQDLGYLTIEQAQFGSGKASCFSLQKQLLSRENLSPESGSHFVATDLQAETELACLCMTLLLAQTSAPAEAFESVPVSAAITQSTDESTPIPELKPKSEPPPSPAHTPISTPRPGVLLKGMPDNSLRIAIVAALILTIVFMSIWVILRKHGISRHNKRR